MLGITLADAVTVSTLIIALLAAWRGAIQGQYTKEKLPPENPFMLAGAAFADSMAMRDQTTSVTRLAIAVEEIAELLRRLCDDHRNDELHELMDRISKLEGKSSRRS